MSSIRLPVHIIEGVFGDLLDVLLAKSKRCLGQFLMEQENELSWIDICQLKVLLDLVWLSVVEHLPTCIQIESLHPDHVVLNLLATSDKNLSCLFDQTSVEQTRNLFLEIHLCHGIDFTLRDILGLFLVLGKEYNLRSLRCIQCS